MFNEILSDAVIRHCLGVSFSPRTLKVRIISEVEDYCLKNGVPMVSDRTIRNYVALLKSIGLKFVAKPQLRDLKCTSIDVVFAMHVLLTVLRLSHTKDCLLI